MSDQAPNILAKIAKLRNMTTAAGCTEAEASVAFAKMAHLMAEHNISEAQLGHYTTSKDFIRDNWTYTGGNDWTAVNRGIEDLFQVKIWITYEQTEFGRMTQQFCYGLPADVAAAMALSEICYLAVATETERYRKTKTKERKQISGFQIGMAVRLAQRIREIKESVPGQHLVVHRKAEVFEAWSHTEWAFRGRAVGRVAYNPLAMAAGARAANSVRLGVHRELSGTKLIRG